MYRNKVIAANRSSKFEYDIEKFIEAGLSLYGSEVKSLKSGGGDLSSSFVKIEKGEAFVYGFTIQKYQKSYNFSLNNYDPNRPKKLLLKKSEIDKLYSEVKRAGYSIIPVEAYIGKNGFIKLKIGLGKGRKKHDKREYLKERDIKREFRKEKFAD